MSLFYFFPLLPHFFLFLSFSLFHSFLFLILYADSSCAVFTCTTLSHRVQIQCEFSIGSMSCACLFFLSLFLFSLFFFLSFFVFLFVFSFLISIFPVDFLLVLLFQRDEVSLYPLRSICNNRSRNPNGESEIRSSSSISRFNSVSPPVEAVAVESAQVY